MKRSSRAEIAFHPAYVLLDEASSQALRGKGGNALSLALAAVKMLKTIILEQAEPPPPRNKKRRP